MDADTTIGRLTKGPGMDATVGQLAARCGGEVHGDAGRLITRVDSLSKADPDTITFFADRTPPRELETAQAGAILIERGRLEELSEPQRNTCTLITVDDALDAFILLLTDERPRRNRPTIGLSHHAVIADSARIGEGTNVYPGAFVSEDVVIGTNCDVFPGAYIGPGCRLADNVTIHPGVVLYPDIEIGHRCIIHAGTAIGADGFGYRFRNGCHERIPHLGHVHIEDDVEIGACSTIDRGAVHATVIGEGSKIDNLVNVAHNCEIGKHNAFAAQVGFAGSCNTGDYVLAGGQAGIADHVNVGTGASLGAGSGFTRNVPAGETWFGSPARPGEEAAKMLIAMTRLPDMRSQLRKLDKQVQQLTAQMNQLTALDDAA
jgi:UDP-3-O-[3-hydroxymyristoyl] glucosamine N-acyltransferase